jgi:hypothetical protein
MLKIMEQVFANDFKVFVAMLAAPIIVLANNNRWIRLT